MWKFEFETNRPFYGSLKKKPLEYAYLYVVLASNRTAVKLQR